MDKLKSLQLAAGSSGWSKPIDEYLADKRYFIISPENGLGNRLRAMCSFILISNYLKIPTLVYWEGGEGFDGTPLEELIDVDSLGVKVVSKELWENVRKKSFKIDENISGVYENSIEEASSHVPKAKDQKRKEFINNIFEGKYKQITARATNFMPWAFYRVLIEPYIPNWWKEYREIMHKIQPSKKVLAGVNNETEKFSPETYGMHIRRGDAVDNDNPNRKHYLQSSNNAFIMEAEYLLKNPAAKIYLATDDKDTLEFFRSEFGDRILYRNKEFQPSLFNALKSGQIDATTEMFALSKCKRILGTHFSSFGLIAADLGNKHFDRVLDTPDSLSEFRNRNVKFSDIQRKQGVTLINCCMNRNDNLKLALPTWLAADGLNEIVLLDWSSDEPVENLVPEDTNGKIVKVVRARGQSRWALSWAFNLAASFASYSKIAKIDADILLMPDFFRKHDLARGEFCHGSWRVARNDNELHLNGQMLCWLKDFWEVNGYHEKITSYGWDDDDLYLRLAKNLKLKEKVINNDKLHHIQTKFEKRAEHQDEFKDIGEEALGKVLFDETMKNRVWALKNPWGKNEPLKDWEIKEIKKNIFTCVPR
jgi:hypothetical protein